MTCKPAVDCSLLQDVFDHNHDYDTLPDVLKQNALDPDISGLGVSILPPVQGNGIKEWMIGSSCIRTYSLHHFSTRRGRVLLWRCSQRILR